MCSGAIGFTPRVSVGTTCSGVPSARRTPMAAAICAGLHRPVCCSSSMKKVLTDAQVPVRRS